jgi:uncharacterized protein YcaQ
VTTNTIVNLSWAEARQLTLQGQLLSSGPRLPVGKAGAAQAIEHLGYVQIDTVNVVAHLDARWIERPESFTF